MKKRKKPINKEVNLNCSFCKNKKALNNSDKKHYKSIIQHKNINENEISHKEVKKSFNIIDCDEYEECLKKIDKYINKNKRNFMILWVVSGVCFFIMHKN